MHYDFTSSDGVSLGTQTVTMIITATQAAKTVEISFTLELVDPCLSTTISIDQDIMDAYTLYKIYPSNIAYMRTFDISLVTYSPQITG